MAGPLLVLYGISIGVAHLAQRLRRAAASMESEKVAP
jgi:hypothetical protein